MTANIASESPTVAATAAIIPFPQRLRPAAPVPEQRLVRALDTLETAMAEQRAAIVAWRDALGTLRTSTAGLDESLKRYRNSLRTLANSVSAMRVQTRALEAWATNMAANNRTV